MTPDPSASASPEQQEQGDTRGDSPKVTPSSGSTAATNETKETTDPLDQKRHEQAEWAGYPLTWGDEG